MPRRPKQQPVVEIQLALLEPPAETLRKRLAHLDALLKVEPDNGDALAEYLILHAELHATTATEGHHQ